MAKHLNKVIDIENNTLAILHIEDMFVILQCVFHGIRLLRLRRIGCRETINFFFVPIFREIFHMRYKNNQSKDIGREDRWR